MIVAIVDGVVCTLVLVFHRNIKAVAHFLNSNGYTKFIVFFILLEWMYLYMTDWPCLKFYMIFLVGEFCCCCCFLFVCFFSNVFILR